jgi:Tol biopolymer transport system component
MEFPEGLPELIAEEANWPRLSADSSRLVYIAVDPDSGEHQLKISDPDGWNIQDVVLFGHYIPYLKDTPFFSPDGKSILFSGDVPGASHEPNWFEELAGIRVAKANGESFDWWSVPITAREVTRITYLHTSHLHASISPDKKYVASFSRDNLFVMKPDGSEITVIIPGLNRLYGIVNWIP